MMQTRLSLRPGDVGTRRLCKVYGEQLVCVRYRYDPEKRKRFKTIELIVEESAWKPPIPVDTIVPVRVDYGERGLREKVKAAGGRWNKAEKVWELSYGQACRLRLMSRIIQEGK